jgi:hypothetical protein
MEGTQSLQQLPQRELFGWFKMGGYVSGNYLSYNNPFALITFITRSLL